MSLWLIPLTSSFNQWLILNAISDFRNMWNSVIVYDNSGKTDVSNRTDGHLAIKNYGFANFYISKHGIMK